METATNMLDFNKKYKMRDGTKILRLEESSKSNRDERPIIAVWLDQYGDEFKSTHLSTGHFYQDKEDEMDIILDN